MIALCSNKDSDPPPNKGRAEGSELRLKLHIIEIHLNEKLKFIGIHQSFDADVNIFRWRKKLSQFAGLILSVSIALFEQM